MLRVENVKFRYGNAGTEFNFNFHAHPGEIIGIMGPSGSGKSTLLDLVAGFQIPDQGEIFWEEKNISQLPPELRPVTVLFQNYNLFEHLSAEQNVTIGVKSTLRISSEEQALVQKAFADVGLTGLENQLAATLSGGQQQRVALARSIVRNKPILLLDEPFSGLDADNRSEILRLIKQLAERQKRCVLMVTHDVADCHAIATRRYMVDTGVLVEQD